jgi:rRNA processing protein Krr1/Pno1
MEEISKIIKTLENCNIQLIHDKQIIILRDVENCYEAQDVISHLSN